MPAGPAEPGMSVMNDVFPRHKELPEMLTIHELLLETLLPEPALKTRL